MTYPDWLIAAARDRLHDDDHVFHVMYVPPGVGENWTWCSRDDSSFTEDHDPSDPQRCRFVDNSTGHDGWLIATREDILNIRPVPTTLSAWSVT